MGAMPDCPRNNACQVASVPMPTGLTRPIPVTTIWRLLTMACVRCIDHHQTDRRKRIYVDRSLKFLEFESLGHSARLILAMAERCRRGLQDFIGQPGIVYCPR